MKLIIVFVILAAAHVHATFDYSNMDLKNFQYFKYPPTTTQKPVFFYRHGHLYSVRKIPDPPNKIEKITDTANRAHAVFKYFKELALGRDEERMKSKHVVDPVYAEKLKHSFQSKHGKHGEKLVKFLGSGPSRENLIKAGAI